MGAALEEALWWLANLLSWAFVLAVGSVVGVSLAAAVVLWARTFWREWRP